jgi:hypothetical protein
MEDEDFLAAVEADNTNTPVAEEKVETPPEPTPQESEAPKAEDVLELDTPVEAPKQPEPGFVPLAAMLDTRDKLKAAEAELARYRAAQQQTQPVEMPDPYEDPEGFQAAQQAQVNSQLYQMNLRFSERLATVQHGPEKVAAARDWAFQKCAEDPHFNAKVLASDDPFGIAISEYEREQIASKVTPDEFAQFQAWKAAQSQVTQQAASTAPPNQTSAIPPRSLASAPSAGSILTEPVQSDEEIFAEVLPKR